MQTVLKRPWKTLSTNNINYMVGLLLKEQGVKEVTLSIRKILLLLHCVGHIGFMQIRCNNCDYLAAVKWIHILNLPGSPNLSAFSFFNRTPAKKVLTYVLGVKNHFRKTMKMYEGVLLFDLIF